MKNSCPGKTNPIYWIMACIAFVLCFHSICFSAPANDEAMPSSEKRRRTRLQEEMAKAENEGRDPSRDVLRLKAHIDVVDLFVELNDGSRPPSDKPCLEHLPSTHLNDQSQLPFDKPDYRELEINLLYRNVVFWSTAQHACDQDEAVQAYISMNWNEHEEKLALEAIRTRLQENEWTSESLHIVRLLTEFPHRCESPEFAETFLALVTAALKDLGPEGRVAQSRRENHACLAVQALGILDCAESSRLLRTVFYEPHVLLGNSIDIDSSIVTRIRQHVLLGYLYRSADEALDFYREALEYIAEAVGHDNGFAAKMPPEPSDAPDNEEEATPAPNVHVGSWHANQLYLTCLFCIDEMWRRKMGEPAKLPEVLRFQRERETLFKSYVFGKCEFPQRPWSLYDIQGVLHEFPLGKEPFRGGPRTERQQWRGGHFMVIL